MHHSHTGSTAHLAGAAIEGANDPEAGDVQVRSLSPLDAGPDDVRTADALLLATPENFGYMSGAMKHFFDTIYYPCLDHTQGKPWALIVKAGNDGQGALGAITRIVTGLRWRLVAEPVVVVGEVESAHLEQCRELGLTLAAGLDAGLF
ncbi:MAG: flavodoxin family protein [Gammaproteobacteria bacterium]